MDEENPEERPPPYKTLRRAMRVIDYLVKHPWSPIDRMKRDLRIPHASLTRLLKVMTELGILERRVSLSHKRRWYYIFRVRKRL